MKNILLLEIYRFKLINIAIPPPKYFENLLGVDGDARFVALWCESNTLFWGDGCRIYSGNSDAWNMWRWCISVDILQKYCFGHGHQDPDHRLILDRQSRKCYAAPVHLALGALKPQFSAHELATGFGEIDDDIVNAYDDIEQEAAMLELQNWIKYQYHERFERDFLE